MPAALPAKHIDLRTPAARRAPYRWAGMAALGLYLLLALALTYPLLLNIATHVPGDGRDDPPLVWSLWWVRYALLDLHTNPLNSAYMFFPIGVNLTYFTLTLLNGALSIPIQFTAGLVTASNVLLLSSYALAGFGAYLLALHVLAPRRSWGIYLAAFVAGLVYAFGPIKMVFASLGQFNMASTQWIPFYVLYLLRATRLPAGRPRPSLRQPGLRGRLLPGWDRRAQTDACKAALFLLVQAYAEVTFASFLAIFTAVYLAWLPLRRDLRAIVWGRLAILGGVFGLGFWPILGSMLSEIAREGDYSLSAGWGFADVFANDLLGFFTPSALHPVFGAAAAEISTGFSYTNFGYVGFVALLLGMAGFWAWRRAPRRAGRPSAGFWGGSALLYALLSLGPILHIGGRSVFDLDGLLVRLPLPFIVLHFVPFIKANRYPNRLSVLLLLCLAVLVALGVAWLLRRLGGRALRLGLSGLLSAAILFEYLAVPLPLSDLSVPAVYSRIAQDNAGAPVLQLPLSWRNSFQFIPQSFTALPQRVNTVVMFEQFYQTVHQGPILSGNTSRNPEQKFIYFLEAPVIRSLVALEEGRTLTAEQMAYDRSVLPAVLRFFGFKYIVLHPPLVGGPVEEYVRSLFPIEPIAADAGLAAYRVLPTTPARGPLTIDMGSDMSRLYLAEGWGEPQTDDLHPGAQPFRWTARPTARVLLPASASSAMTVTVDFAWSAYGWFELRLNGRKLVGYDNSSDSLSRVNVRVPAGVAQPGLNELLITARPLDTLAPERAKARPAGQTGSSTPSNIVVRSAGLDAGGDLGLAHVYVNGKDALRAGRGINVAVFGPGNAAVQSTARFDVLGDPAANQRFLDYIKAVPEGRIVAVAVMDEASTNFDGDALAALRLIGAQTDLRGKFRWSYAAIGARGAKPGQALESLAQGRPASVAVGAHIFTDFLGVAVSKVTVEQ